MSSMGSGKPAWVLLRLFKAYVETTMLSGCEIWGTKLGVRGVLGSPDVCSLCRSSFSGKHVVIVQ